MKAAVLEKYNHFEWKDVPTPVITDDELLVKVGYASICGSDLHVYRGEFGARTQLPLIPGHEFMGQVVGVGAKVQKIQKGERIAVDPIFWCGQCPACQRGHYPACHSLKLKGIDTDGGFAEYVAVKEFMAYPVGATISDRHAALVEVLAIGFHACNRSGVKAGDSVAIWGAGRIGQVILRAVRTITSAPVFMVDIVPKRLQMASALYSDVIPVSAMDTDPVAFIKNHTNGFGVDVAFEAVGHASSIPKRLHPIRSCVHAIRGGGMVCLLGLADEAVPLVMRELILKEGKIMTSRVSHGEFKTAIQYLEQGVLNPEALITGEIEGKEMQKGFDLLQSHPDQHLKILVRLS